MRRTYYVVSRQGKVGERQLAELLHQQRLGRRLVFAGSSHHTQNVLAPLWVHAHCAQYVIRDTVRKSSPFDNKAATRRTSTRSIP